MQPRYDCNCDAVICMEQMGIGTAEILQYASALLPRKSLRHLVRELEALLDESEVEDCAVRDASENSPKLSEVTT